MKKSVAIILFGASLSALSSAQSASFNFNNAAVAPVDTFSNNGIGVTVSGLSSATMLNQNQSTVTLNASATNILVGDENGIGAGPFSDHELRNGAGTPSLSGATVLELSKIKTPVGTMLDSLNFVMTSVDHGTNEGFLVYGSNQDATKGSAQLTLLDHGMGNSSDIGSFNVSKNQLAQYSNFYVTADNGFYSSVLLGSATSFHASPVPEPATVAGLAIGFVALLRRRKSA